MTDTNSFLINSVEMDRASGLQTIKATVNFKAIGPTVKAQGLPRVSLGLWFNRSTPLRVKGSVSC